MDHMARLNIVGMGALGQQWGKIHKETPRVVGRTIFKWILKMGINTWNWVDWTIEPL